MYFPALKKAIQNLEEKGFYAIALMYLEQRGYRDLSIVDGPGDGGRDVTCSRTDLRIQLSVRRDWENKINQEALNTHQAGKRHLIYVTNRIISPDAEESFRDADYSHIREARQREGRNWKLQVEHVAPFIDEPVVSVPDTAKNS